MQPSVPERAPLKGNSVGIDGPHPFDSGGIIYRREHPLDPTVLHAVRRHGRIWRTFLTQSFNREMQFRANFTVTIVVGLLQLGLALIPVLLLYGFTDDVKGWGRSESIALIGMFQLVFGVLNLAIGPNALGFQDYVQQGELDMVAIRPMSAQFYVMTRWMQPAEIFSVLSGIAVLIVGLAGHGWPPLSGVIQMLVLLVCGTTMLACVWCAISWLSFWIVTAGPLSDLAGDIMQAGRYPVSFFPFAIRVVFVGLIPIAFATTFPVEALLGRGDWRVVVAGIGLTILILFLLRAWWRLAIRNYTSASS